MSMNIFERAARNRTRFQVTGGNLTVEDLFDLPLTASGNKRDLDKVAREIYAELKGYEETSFVSSKPEPRKIELQLQMDLVKHVIESKQRDLAAAETRAATLREERRLLEVLEKKEGQKFEAMDEAAIRQRLAEIRSNTGAGVSV